MKRTDNVDIKDKVQIEVSTMNWGPCVVKLRILDDFKKILLDEARNTEIDFRDKLAGQIAKERGYNEKQREKIIPFLSPYLGVYDECFQRFQNERYKSKPVHRMTIFGSFSSHNSHQCFSAAFEFDLNFEALGCLTVRIQFKC